MGNGNGNALTGLAGNDVLKGNAGVDVLPGGSGNDLLDGGVQADLMVGGTGNVTYIVDNAGDATVEAAGGGIDLVQSIGSFALAANFENLTLTGAANVNGTGNALANLITGNLGNNVLVGGPGADTLVGGAGAGADTLTGGAGQDVYAFSIHQRSAARVSTRFDSRGARYQVEQADILRSRGDGWLVEDRDHRNPPAERRGRGGALEPDRGLDARGLVDVDAGNHREMRAGRGPGEARRRKPPAVEDAGREGQLLERQSSSHLSPFALTPVVGNRSVGPGSLPARGHRCR